MSDDDASTVRLSRGKAPREPEPEEMRTASAQLPPCITPISLTELEEMRSRWCRPPSDPSRRPHDLHQGEFAVFLFQTEAERVPAEGLSHLLAVASVKIFLVTTGVQRPALLRRRVEPEKEEEEEEGLFPAPTPSGASPSPLSSQAAPRPSQNLPRSTQDALQDGNLFTDDLPKLLHPANDAALALRRRSPRHYSRFYHLEPDLPPRELPPALQALAVAHGAVLGLKTLTSTALIPCYAALPPVFTPQHLHALVSQPGVDPSGFTLLMIGASDCPPCRKVLQNATSLWSALPPSTRLYKADWYLAKEAREVVRVDLIPYFVLFANTEILRNPNPAPHDDPAAAASDRWTPVATLQDSNVDTIVCFLHQHTMKLSFDEDF
eukprot:gene5612-4032_t